MVRFFPIDHIGDIPCRLPVKSLVRFKSLSRPWHSLMDDPCFVGSHLKHATETNRGSKLITRFLSELDLLCAEDLDSLGTGNLVKLGLPTKNNWSECISLLGSCNGLICLGDCENLILWNKLTGEYRNVGLPPGALNQEQKLLPFRSHGFGYDSKNDDYKIMGIVDYYSKGYVFRRHEIKVYSLRNNTWKSIQCRLPFFSGGAKTEDQMGKGLLACGALNWLAFWDDWIVTTNIFSSILLTLQLRCFMRLVCLRIQTVALWEN
ncbi:hypothetical protein SLEP1_g10667 [Rubroshorea leprosula]|uniref:F-box domain-containing protein n=1 Tax=Rubroshorea leprosula TaxID=152421 RepID=A0AAV5IJN6_9ROSI|nr:hypothetical protein SLEP1_g10667 [Rubroshorea leprosula]